MAELHVRNVPSDLHERLRARASAEDRSMSAEVIAILRTVLDQPSGVQRSEAVARLRRIQDRSRFAPGELPAEALVREDREAR